MNNLRAFCMLLLLWGICPSVMVAEPPIAASEMDAYLTDKSSPLAGQGPTFLSNGEQHRVDPRLVIAIAGAESTFGQNITRGTYNAWNWLSRNPNFSSWGKGIFVVTEGLRRLYFDTLKKTTIPAIGATYCQEGCADWVPNVTLFYASELGGDLSDLTYTARPKAKISFTSRFDAVLGPQPLGLVVADFDGDERKDIAVSIYNRGGGDHLTVLHNIGTPGHLDFDLPVDFLIGRGPEGIAAGDLNNDGKVDLVSANADSVDVSVLRNTSSRGFIDFQPVFPRLSIFGTPHRVAIADFDKDGRPDLIVTSNSGRLVSVYHHVADPNTLAFDYRRDYGAGGYLNDLVVADIDRDTRSEILVPASDLLTIFQNNSSPGNVQASALPPLEAGTPPIRGLAVGDLNNDPDHALDVVVAALGGVGVFQNSSSPGVFKLPRTEVPTETNPDAVAIGDLDKDGLADVVVANPDEDTISILQNRSTGRPIVLTPLDQRLETGVTPITLVLGDVDSDGWLDIVVVNHEGNSISVLLNTTGRQ